MSSPYIFFCLYLLIIKNSIRRHHFPLSIITYSLLTLYTFFPMPCVSCTYIPIIFHTIHAIHRSHPCTNLGNPTNTTSYCSIFSTLERIAGRHPLSFISTVLRLFLSIQSRSASVYGISGSISNRSAPVSFASFSATLLVTPLALKYAVNILLIVEILLTHIVIDI